MSNPKSAMLTEDEASLDEAGRGRLADRPNAIPWKGLKDVLWRVAYAVGTDRISLIAAGVTFFMLLASFPALGLLATVYGFVADRATISSQVAFVAGFLPPGGFELITDQLTTLVSQKNSTLSFAAMSSFALALWSASSGVKAVFDAMNVAYGEDEKRSWIKLNLAALACTLVATILAVVLILAVGVVPAVMSFLHMGGIVELLTRLARWPLALVFVGAGITLIYRYGPSREPAKLRWVSWGAMFSTGLWIATSVGFSYYLQHFANYNASYGALGTLIGFMIWVWISVIILIVGAELNAELEHQTLRDSTTGQALPIGSRGAFVADTIGKPADKL